MNENIDLTKILEGCPKGTKFYSPLFGEVELNYIYGCRIGIACVKMNRLYIFNAAGKYQMIEMKCSDSDGNYYYFTTNYRVIIENNLQEVLEYLCEPIEHHEKRVTVRFTTDRGVSHEFVRHRVFSFAMESTRYCNYSKDKFNNKITFIIPSWMNMEESNVTTDSFGVPVKPSEETCDFLSVLGSAEKNYFRLINKGWKPQQARQILPNALKTELVMTGFVSDWQYLFRLRTSFLAETGKPHPDMSNLCDPLYKEFVNRGLVEPLI